MELSFLLACDTLPTNPWERDRLPTIRKALQGYDFEIVDIYQFNSVHEAHQIHIDKAKSFFLDHDLDELNEKFYKIVVASHCNVLILGTIDNYIHFLLPETIKRLQNEGVFIVGILGDDEFTYKRNRLYVPLFDKTIAYVKKYVDYYNLLKSGSCYYFPNSCHLIDSDFAKLQIDEKDKQHDVIVIGAPSGKRPEMIEALINAGINVSLFGNPRWNKNDLFKNHYRGFIHSDDFNRTVQQSKIILAFMEDHITGALHMNTKIWEAVTVGQMPIATYYEPLINDYGFVENKDIVMYHSTSDLVEKVRYYLENPDKRIQIANNLFQKVSESFDYFDLYKDLFKSLVKDFNDKESTKSDWVSGFSPNITIIDCSKNGETHDGFKYLRIPEKKAFKHLKNNFHDLIETDYVLLTFGGIHYSPCLNSLVELFPDTFEENSGFLYLSCRNDPATDKKLNYIGCVIWEKKVFFARYLFKNHRSKYILNKISTNTISNVKLLCNSNKRFKKNFLCELVRKLSLTVILYTKKIRSIFQTEYL